MSAGTKGPEVDICVSHVFSAGTLTSCVKHVEYEENRSYRLVIIGRVRNYATDPEDENCHISSANVW